MSVRGEHMDFCVEERLEEEIMTGRLKRSACANGDGGYRIKGAV
jgi:hypothetical protein